jgi:CPA2 family monovalent cation:H+ antiporter-2
MSLAQIGEFSFILATLGSSLGATRDFLYPIAVAVSAVTTLTTPWLIRASGPTAAWLDARLPRRLQTFVALYGSWLEQLRSSPSRATLGARVRRIVRALVVDLAAVAAIVIGTSVAADPAGRRIAEVLGIGARGAGLVLWTAAAALAVPFCVGLLRNAHALGVTLAGAALPPGAAGRPDLAAAPRRALVAVVQLGATVLVLLPVAALTQPFLPGVPGAVVIALAIVVLGAAFWRTAANLQGHVRAGAQVIVEALAKQADAGHPEPPGDALSGFRAMFPGLGDPQAVRLRPGSPAAGSSLSELAVRGRTGASVLAISRADGSVIVPTASERLREGDVLALSGTHEAIAAAQELLGADALVQTGGGAAA